MMQPNWFDVQFGEKMEKEKAEQVLAEIAKSPRVIKALREALSEFDGRAPMPGPSRSQVIRRAIADVLNADPEPAGASA